MHYLGVLVCEGLLAARRPIDREDAFRTPRTLHAVEWCGMGAARGMMPTSKPAARAQRCFTADVRHEGATNKIPPATSGENAPPHLGLLARYDAPLLACVAAFLLVSSACARHVSPAVRWPASDGSTWVAAVDVGGAAASLALLLVALGAALSAALARAREARLYACVAALVALLLTATALCVSDAGLVLVGRTGLRIPLPLLAVDLASFLLALITYDGLVALNAGHAVSAPWQLGALLLAVLLKELLLVCVRLHADVPRLWAAHILDLPVWALFAATRHYITRHLHRPDSTLSERVVLYYSVDGVKLIFAVASTAINMAYAAGLLATLVAEEALIWSILVR
jgi:hypothetical protein